MQIQNFNRNINIFVGVCIMCQEWTQHVLSMPRADSACTIRAKSGLCMYYPCQERTLHVLSMPRADSACTIRAKSGLCMYYPCQERTYLMSAIGFGISFGLIILENRGIDHKSRGVAWVHPWYWNYFLNLFYTWMKVRSWSKPHTFQFAFHPLNADHLNIDDPPFPVKCVWKFRSALGREVVCVCVCVCARAHVSLL